MSTDVVEKSEAAEIKRHPTQYRPGQSGNPAGRPKGSRGKLGEDFLRTLQEDFRQHGAKAVETVRETKPADYLKVIASVLPKAIQVNAGALAEINDNDIARILEAVRTGNVATVGEGSGSRAAKTIEHQPAEVVQPVSKAD